MHAQFLGGDMRRCLDEWDRLPKTGEARREALISWVQRWGNQIVSDLREAVDSGAD